MILDHRQHRSVVSPLTEVLLTAQRWSVSRLAGQAGFYRGEEISEITENWGSSQLSVSQGFVFTGRPGELLENQYSDQYGEWGGRAAFKSQ